MYELGTSSLAVLPPPLSPHFPWEKKGGRGLFPFTPLPLSKSLLLSLAWCSFLHSCSHSVGSLLLRGRSLHLFWTKRTKERRGMLCWLHAGHNVRERERWRDGWRRRRKRKKRKSYCTSWGSMEGGETDFFTLGAALGTAIFRGKAKLMFLGFSERNIFP